MPEIYQNKLKEKKLLSLLEITELKEQLRISAFNNEVLKQLLELKEDSLKKIVYEQLLQKYVILALNKKIKEYEGV